MIIFLETFFKSLQGILQKKNENKACKTYDTLTFQEFFKKFS